MLVDLAAVPLDIVGAWGSYRKGIGRQTVDVELDEWESLPLVTFKLARGTTALEVNAPPVHYSELESFDFLGETQELLTFWQSVQWQSADKYSSTITQLAPTISNLGIQ